MKRVARRVARLDREMWPPVRRSSPDPDAKLTGAHDACQSRRASERQNMTNPKGFRQDRHAQKNERKLK